MQAMNARSLAPALGRRLAVPNLRRMAHIVDPGMERLVLRILQALKHQGGRCGATRSMHSKTSRDLPIPASPWISTALAAGPRRHACWQSSSASQFAAAPHEGSQMLMAFGEAKRHRPRLAHLPDTLGIGEAFERMTSCIAEGEAALRQAIGRVVDADGARRRERLDARRQMQGGADREGIGNIVLPVDRAVDDQARRDADAHLDCALPWESAAWSRAAIRARAQVIASCALRPSERGEPK